MRILYVSASFKPSYGGPAYSVARLARAIGESGHAVGLWAPDGSAAEARLDGSNADIALLKGTLFEAVCTFGRPDILHDSGIWRPHNNGVARLAAREHIPLVVSTRGMLSLWARGHKQTKKMIAWLLYQRRNLQKADRLHATSEEEGRQLRDFGLFSKIEVIPNGVDIPEDIGAKHDNSRRKAVFLGRLYPVKGLPMIIEAWSRVAPAGWSLDIAGPDEGGHLAELTTAVKRFGLGDTVRFLGTVSGEAKFRFLTEADLFILPSHSESFGMAIAEAFAHGLPVLTTTAAPWSMIVDEGCGWWVDPTVESLTDALRKACSTDTSTLRSMGLKGRLLVRSRFGWETIANRFLEVYGEMAS